LEDDLIVHDIFLNFMNESLNRYAGTPEIASVQGFSIIERKDREGYFLKGADCWGWATWREQWESVDWNSNELLAQIKKSKKVKEFNYQNSYNFLELLRLNSEGKIDSWAIDWQASMFLQGRYSLYPPFNLVENAGHGTDATNTSQDLSNFRVPFDRSVWSYPNRVFVDHDILNLVGDKYLTFYQRPLFVSKMIRFVKNRLDRIVMGRLS
jgi:hypothetical protein